MVKNPKKLGLTGLVLGASILATNPTHAQLAEKVKVEENNSSQIIATFEYKSNRPEPEYNGVPHQYHLKSNLEVSQEGAEDVNIIPIGWGYDVNKDGVVNEEDSKLVPLTKMHSKFNKKVKKAYEEKYKQNEEQIESLEGQVENLKEELGKIKELEIEKEDLKKTKKEQRRIPLSVIVGASRGNLPEYFGKPQGLYGMDIGVKSGRFAIVVNASTILDRNIQSTEERLAKDIYFIGKEDIENFSSWGFAVEYHHPISLRWSQVVGIGGNLETYTKNAEASLIKRNNQDSVINSNSQSSSEREFVGRIYTGPSFKVNDYLGINLNIGYEAAFKDKELKGRGPYVSLRAIFSIPNKHKGNR